MYNQNKKEKIINFRWNTSNMNTQSFFVFSLHFERLFVYQLTSTYFQKCMLWLLAYLTLLVPIKSFNERFLRAATALLVFAALLGSMQNHLPKSSKMNFIDFWFLLYIINIFFIIVFQVVLENLNYSYNTKEMVNKSISFILPIVMLVFNVAYFSLSCSCSNHYVWF